MKAGKFGGLLPAAIGAVLLLATACVPPGGELNKRASAAEGPETLQDSKVPKGIEHCNVDSPEADFQDATFGFSQTENNNPWRIAQTTSMRQKAEELGVDLVITDAQSSTVKQVSDIQDMIAQGIDLLFVAPREEQGLAPAFDAADEAGVPIILVDRTADAKACEDYVTFIGSDFVAQGERAAEWLLEATNGKAKIVELQGSLGASVTIDRGEGFQNVVREKPGVELVASQSGDFTRAGGQAVMEQLLGAFSDIDAVYAHNDEMAIGAVQAIKDAGLTPGEDVVVVSVDGTRDALELIVAGEMGATVETNPRFGPLAFEVAKNLFEGEPIPTEVIVQDRLFEEGNAEKFVNSAY